MLYPPLILTDRVLRKIASQIAASTPPERAIVVDAFCGVGGNTIAFALSGRWKRVYAIEKDPVTLVCAKHNAAIYGVSNQITWFEGDCFDVLGVNEAETPSSVPALREIIRQYGVVFASPPWGGKSCLLPHDWRISATLTFRRSIVRRQRNL